MNAHNQRQLPNNTNNVQDKLSMILIESQEHLKRLNRSIDKSKEFNKKAKEYLVNSARFTSLSLTK